MRFGSLFAGIGGLDLGLERAGMRCVWQVEIDAYCRRVLAKHWPDVRRHDDIKTFPPDGDWTCDLICGGFPCQDISNAGKRAGINGERSGLWSEFARIIGVVRPGYVLVENVAALLSNGLGRVLGDLAALGYDAEWDCLPAAAFGAPHYRERIFLVANPSREHGPRRGLACGVKPDAAQSGRDEKQAADANGQHGRARRTRRPACGSTRNAKQAQRQEVGANAREPRLSLSEQTGRQEPKEAAGILGGSITECDWWAVEPDVVRMVHGVPSRVDRIRALGNSVVPQVAEWIGRRILTAAGAA